MEKTVLAPCFTDCGWRVAGGGVDEVAGQGVVVRQVFAGEHLFRADFVAQGAVGEAAAQPVFQGVVLRRGNAADDAAYALGGDGVGVVFTLHEDELAVAAVFLVQR